MLSQTQTDSGHHVSWSTALMMLALLIAAWGGLFYDTLVSMVLVWWRSETFAHGFIILPITVFLLWRIRRRLADYSPTPTLLPVPLIFLAGFGWLLAHFASVDVVQQLAAVATLQLLILSVVGWRLALQMLFPLLFLFFAVPIGEGLIPPMMDITADFTVAMLQMTGIPVFREGLFFEIPSGRWSVVEGCSGVRYLIASITLGCLYAYLTYTSYWRRALFMLASIVVPIIANGMRAYLIVMIADMSDYKLAMGVDHFIYGWVWFGIVIMLMFWIGSFWRQDETENVSSATPAVVTSSQAPMLRALLPTALVLFIAPVWAMISDSQHSNTTVNLAVPQVKNWQAQTQPMTEWTPHYQGAGAELMQTYRDGQSHAALYVAYYREQHQDAELINSQNVLIEQKHLVWSQLGLGGAAFELNGKPVEVMRGRLRATHGQKLAVVYWYWLGDTYTTNPYWAKWLEAKAKLLGQPRDGAVIMLVAEYDEQMDEAMSVLARFAVDVVPATEQMLRDVAQSGRQ